ncbi:MAG TPA: MarR family transcriptional regulator [Myxococcota bacterium]
MATVSDLKGQVDEVLLLLRQLVGKRQIRDPLAHLHPDLTGPQIHVLATLGTAGTPLPMNELAHNIGASSPTLTGIIDRLERHGLVSRERDGSDRRLVLIALTADGQLAFSTLQDDVRLKISNLLSCLTHDERCSFVHLIGRIAGVLSSSSNPAEAPAESESPSEKSEKPTP